MATDPIGYDTRRISSRVDLVSSLLRDAELVTNPERTAANEFHPLDGAGPADDGPGTAWRPPVGNASPSRRPDLADAVAKWYLRGTTGLEELLLQLYFGHLSMAEVESVASILWGQTDAASLVREVVPGIIDRIHGWMTGPLQPFYPYIFLHSVEYRCRRVTEASGMQIAAAVGINPLGYREALGIVAAPLGSTGLWDSLLDALATRGVRSPRVVVGGTTDGAMRVAVANRWEGCGFLMPLSELERGISSRVNPSDFPWVENKVAELRACVSRSESERIGLKLRDRLKKAGYAALSVDVSERLHRHLACFDIPATHRSRLRCANLVRTELNRMREQARILGPINEENTIVLLAAATFRRQSRIAWNAKPFLSF